MTKMYFGQKCILDKKKQKHINNKTKSKHKNPCQSWESNPRPLAPQSDELPLDQRDNFIIYVYRLKSSNLNVST